MEHRSRVTSGSSEWWNTHSHTHWTVYAQTTHRISIQPLQRSVQVLLHSQTQPWLFQFLQRVCYSFSSAVDLFTWTRQTHSHTNTHTHAHWRARPNSHFIFHFPCGFFLALCACIHFVFAGLFCWCLQWTQMSKNEGTKDGMQIKMNNLLCRSSCEWFVKNWNKSNLPSPAVDVFAILAIVAIFVALSFLRRLVGFAGKRENA